VVHAAYGRASREYVVCVAKSGGWLNGIAIT
jgi:hypothetical protein